MIANKLEEYATALNELPEEIKNNLVDMMSVKDPQCGTPGCHAGLVSIVAKYSPELQDYYNKLCECEGFHTTQHYSYERWSDALALYLGFPYNTKYPTNIELTIWARDNADIWDNPYGGEMFSTSRAFGQDTDIFAHSVIIDHFTAMSDRLNKKENK